MELNHLPNRHSGYELDIICGGIRFGGISGGYSYHVDHAYSRFPGELSFREHSNLERTNLKCYSRSCISDRVTTTTATSTAASQALDATTLTTTTTTVAVPAALAKRARPFPSCLRHLKSAVCVHVSLAVPL